MPILQEIETDNINTAVKKSKKINPNKLPFLHAQILETIYSNLSKGENATLEEIAELTDYPQHSKILADAIKSLGKKGFIKGDFILGFTIPEGANIFYKKTIKKLDFKHKIYSDKILKFLKTPGERQSLFEENESISDLNKLGVIHKWYNYLEEFPYSLIEEKIIEYKIKTGSLVVDPFAGSGTTLISANMFHCNAIGFDANPLMTFISKVKTKWNIDLKKFRDITYNVAELFLKNVHNIDKIKFKCGFLKNMPKREINQWLSSTLQKEVALLKDTIDTVKKKDIHNLLLLALSKSCFDASYVALCPGTTFYPFREKEEFWDIFTKKIIQIYNDLKTIQRHNSYGKSKLITDTCLNANKYIEPKKIDFIITSPPYPNDLEYTRQTRLEMYLLDFAKNMKEIQQIKRKMVKGSTKLIFRESDSANVVEHFKDVKVVADKIFEQTKDKNWGFDYPRMVKEYFGDMYLCLKRFYPLLQKNSNFLLVVGDQTIKGVYIPVCDILIKFGIEIGYKNCRKELFRMRRSTGHNIMLPEEIVILKKG